jgi:NADPH2:quinone reductase
MARIVRIHKLGGPEVLRLEDVEVPPPGPGEIRLRVKALGLNRAESMFRTGHYPESPDFPARLGYEAAGVIEALGPGVTGFAVGDGVSIVPPLSITRWGTYGEIANVPAEVTVKHPAHLSWVDAAAVWMQYVTAYGALIEIAGLGKGDAVLITAASSSVGLAAIQIANRVGATPIAATRTAAKAAALRDAGATNVIITDEEDLAARARAITGGAGVRAVFDPVAGPAVNQLAEALGHGGILVEYGALSPEATPFPLFPALVKALTIRGYQYKEIVSDPARFDRAKRFILDGLADGSLKPIVARTFPLDQIVEATRYLESNQQFGKVVVTV